MGCCHSTPPSHNPPSPSSPRSPHPTSPSSPTTAVPGTTAIQAGSRSRARPNAPLRKPKPWRSTSRVWTPRQLRRERDVFWETRVAGREEVWAAVRMAVELARGGGAASADVKAAQAVLDAAGVTCPTGRMGEGVWDERGVLYKLPRWVVSDPVNVGDGDAVDGAGEERVLEDVMETDEEEEEEESKEVGSEEEDAEEAGKRRDEKGKGRGRDAVKVRARLSDRGTDVVVELDREAAVRSVIRRVCELAEIPPKTKVKIAYMGKMLKESDSLINQGWQHGHVVNALVFQ